MRALSRTLIGPKETPLAAPDESQATVVLESEKEIEREHKFEDVHLDTTREIAWFGFVCEASSYAAASFMYSVVLTLANFSPIVLFVSVCTGTAVRLVVTHRYHRVLTRTNIERASNAIINTAAVCTVLSWLGLWLFRDWSTLHLVLHTAVMGTVGLLQQAPVFIATELNRLVRCSVHKHLIRLIRLQLIGRAVGVAVAYCLYVYMYVAPYFFIFLSFLFVRYRYKKSWNRLEACLQGMTIDHASALSTVGLPDEPEQYEFGQS
jgi:hypothetical protein